ncbi:MAG TPA: hypothetical protein VE054_14000 [Blattabacteriaceae bacterium]|nr:hypothetical protein [Blattabacteriaceae bacterium]
MIADFEGINFLLFFGQGVHIEVVRNQTVAHHRQAMQLHGFPPEIEIHHALGTRDKDKLPRIAALGR